MFNVKTARAIGIAAVGAAILTAGIRANAQLGYTFDVTTHYQFGVPGGCLATFTDAGAASPDSGAWMIANNGSTTFTGAIGQVAVSNFAGDKSYSHALVLAPGDCYWFEVDDESSNHGGYN